MTHPRIYALIVAAGTGSRAGGEVPKQYQPIAGRSMLAYSAERLAHHPAIAGVQVVIHPKHQAYYNPIRHALTLLPVAFGGAERADSVAAGLAALAPHAPDYVLIHDAARPFLSNEVIDALIAKLSPERAALPALPVVDTVRRTADGAWEEVPRDGLMRIQTPQVFPFAALHQLYNTSLRGGVADAAPEQSERGDLKSNVEPIQTKENTSAADAARWIATPSARDDGAVPTDDAALWLAAGLPLDYVIGEEELRKVTTQNDLQWAENHVSLARSAASTRRVAVGSGYDVHALVPAGDAGVIRLGGIDIPSAHKLHGHSDADVVLHAVVDALLGAIAEGDIGSHFPPSDARWKGANSSIFVEEARRLVHARGGVIQHLDITIIGERPKISPHREAMREAIAHLLHAPVSRVSVKATTTEKLGFEGREEGIACNAVVTLSLPEDL